MYCWLQVISCSLTVHTHATPGMSIYLSIYLSWFFSSIFSYFYSVTLPNFLQYQYSYHFLLQGAMNRATAATGMNEGSSRSHSVFTVTGKSIIVIFIIHYLFFQIFCFTFSEMIQKIVWNYHLCNPKSILLLFIFTSPHSTLFLILIFLTIYIVFDTSQLLISSLILFFNSLQLVNQKDTRSGIVKSGKLVLVDLAGSEMVNIKNILYVWVSYLDLSLKRKEGEVTV